MTISINVKIVGDSRYRKMKSTCDQLCLEKPTNQDYTTRTRTLILNRDYTRDYKYIPAYK